MSLEYWNYGCFTDNITSPALLSNEGVGYSQLDGVASTRVDAITKCFQVAQQLNHTVFGLRNGSCFSRNDVPGGLYTRYGASLSCPTHGRGTDQSLNVYLRTPPSPAPTQPPYLKMISPPGNLTMNINSVPTASKMQLFL